MSPSLTGKNPLNLTNTPAHFRACRCSVSLLRRELEPSDRAENARCQSILLGYDIHCIFLWRQQPRSSWLLIFFCCCCDLCLVGRTKVEITTPCDYEDERAMAVVQPFAAADALRPGALLAPAEGLGLVLQNAS